MLAQTLEAELGEVGPEDVLSESRLEELQSTLEERVMMMTMIIIVHKELTVSYQKLNKLNHYANMNVVEQPASYYKM